MASKSLDGMADDLGRYTKKVRVRTTKTVNQMARMLKAEIKKNISKQDGHDYVWLKKNDHPYAKRSPRPPHKKPFVHKQGGKWSANMSQHVQIFPVERRGERMVGISEDDVPYVADVLYGTKRMIGRNFIAYSLINMNKKFRKMIRKLGT
jgi:hypothetical protein